MATSTKSAPRRRRSVRRIDSPKDRPDRNGQTLETRNEEVIRAWAAERDAEPAAIRADDGSLRTLRLDFPGGDDLTTERRGSPRHVPWDEWLRTLRDRNLTFRYQERRRDGRTSTFFRLDNPDREDG
jgi:hypothetical protein